MKATAASQPLFTIREARGRRHGWRRAPCLCWARSSLLSPSPRPNRPRPGRALPPTAGRAGGVGSSPVPPSSGRCCTSPPAGARYPAVPEHGHKCPQTTPRHNPDGPSCCGKLRPSNELPKLVNVLRGENEPRRASPGTPPKSVSRYESWQHGAPRCEARPHRPVGRSTERGSGKLMWAGDHRRNVGLRPDDLRCRNRTWSILGPHDPGTCSAKNRGGTEGIQSAMGPPCWGALR